jgi:hypothetical protein
VAFIQLLLTNAPKKIEENIEAENNEKDSKNYNEENVK